MPLPRLALTLGDPAGIGPEVALAAAVDPEVRRACRPVLVGDRAHLLRTVEALGSSVRLSDARFDEPSVTPDVTTVDVLNVPGCPVDLPIGVATAESGRAGYRAIKIGVELCVNGFADAMVTAPINKYAFELAGLGHEGHTELLATMTDSPWSLTLFSVGNLRVLFLTRHLALRDAIHLVTADRVAQTLARFSTVASQLGLENPTIAVAALNPHAGEEGLFGTEEDEQLVPGIAAARAHGLNVVGPVPADAVFAQAREGKYDVVLSLYHDQASAVCKSIDFHGTVSVTLGLPFLRFSVDHGTAFDIAGKGIADSRNMINATLAAAQAVRESRPASVGGRRSTRSS